MARMLPVLILVAACLSPARGQKLVSSALRELGKQAFIVKAPDGADWVFLRLTRPQDQVVREKGPARIGEPVTIDLTLRQCNALGEALHTFSPPQTLKLRVHPKEIHTVQGFTGRYLARKRTTVVAHMRLPAGSGPTSSEAPPAEVLAALPGIIQGLPGRDEDYW